MPLRRALSMIDVSALALVHQPFESNSPVVRSKRIISAVAAAVRRSHAFQVVRAHAVQAISGRLPALPQARSAPTPWVLQLSTSHILAGGPVCPAPPVVAPILLPGQVRPPSNERSIHT